MNDSALASRASANAMPSRWPLSLIAPVGAMLLLLAFFTTMELPMYVHGPNVPRGTVWAVFVSYTITVVGWMMVETNAYWYAQASIDQPRAWFRRHLRRLPAFIACFIIASYGLRYFAFLLVGFRVRFVFPGAVGLFAYESLKAVLLYCCWLGLAFGVLSFARMRQQTEHLLAAQKTLMEAKLTQLQAQLRPHFLFNSLNTISSLMQVDVARADRLLTQLGDLLRANLVISERNVVPVSEELRLLRLYAAIMEERFGSRVKVDWDIDDAASNALVPTMLLQPLLENSFKHGVERRAGNDWIKLSVHREGDMLRIAIHNANSTLERSVQEGRGLRNCRERLRLLYGDIATLRLTDGQGVTATVTLPWTIDP